MTKSLPFIKLALTLFVSTAVMFSLSFIGTRLINGGQQSAIETIKKPVMVAVPVKRISQPGAKAVTVNRVSLHMREVPEELQVVLLSTKTIEIPAQANVSLLGILKKQKLEQISPETLSMLATAIYQAILPTNFTVLERNISNKLPAYADLGYEAKLDPEQNMDLAFSNPNKAKYELKLQVTNNSLVVSLKGGKLPYEYRMSRGDVQYFDPKTVVQYSSDVSPGQIKLASSGTSGEEMKVYRNVYKGDLWIKRELVSDDFYPPDDRVELHSVVAANNQQDTANGDTVSLPTSSESKTELPQSTSDTQQKQQDHADSQNHAGISSNTKVKSANSSDLWGKPNEAAK